MGRPRLLDLFCCAGGAAMGYHQAGFEVVGVDIKPQPRYPFEFIQADISVDPPENFAAWVRARGFEAIHASPPCQAHTSMKTMPDARRHVDLIPKTRAMLRASGLPYVIENVEGARASLIKPFRLCGSMFGLGAKGAQLQRHRLFETNFSASIPMLDTACHHAGRTIGIYGEGCRDSRRKYDKSIPEFTVVDGREAMECPWMTIAELCEAIPPAYTRFIGEQLMAHLQSERIAA
jgi:DNA (cytosine-5)-methyltransferase 1